MVPLRHRRNIQSAAAGVLGESIWPGTAWANLAAFRWPLPMDRYTGPWTVGTSSIPVTQSGATVATITNRILEQVTPGFIW
jgi:hypothetical protein